MAALHREIHNHTVNLITAPKNGNLITRLILIGGVPLAVVQSILQSLYRDAALIKPIKPDARLILCPVLAL